MPLSHSPKASPKKTYPIFNSSQSSNFKRLRTTGSDSDDNPAKDEENIPLRSINDLFDAIKLNNDEIIRSRNEQLMKMDELKNEMNDKFVRVDERLNNVSSLVDKHSSDIDKLQIKMNEIEQDKLAEVMDVIGWEKIVVPPTDWQPRDSHNVASAVFNYYEIDPTCIERSYVRSVSSTGVKILVIIFKSTVEKIEAMKKKREKLNDKKGVYFDHAMTPAIRRLFMKARILSKTIGGKSTQLNNGKVTIIQHDGRKLRILSDDDLEKIRSTMPANDRADNCTFSSALNTQQLL